MESDLVAKYSGPAPRYTSFPTAPHFHPGIDADTYRGWLGELAPDASLSLYLHIPYCQSLCWFCGCHTKATRHYAPIAKYLQSLKEEIRMLGAALPPTASVKRIHWGGGSPTILEAEDITVLAAALRDAFHVAPDVEFSAEIDPRGLTRAQIDALAAAGLTRASLGVQDFNPKVQQAINREQSFALTKAVADAIRLAGIGSINVDVLYGLPHQSTRLLMETLLKVLALKPDRVAVFGYAHVPWIKTHQTMIESEALPDASARFRGSQLAGDLLTAWGYERIGMDHFALPNDPLALAARSGRLRRNFQGYTDDSCEALLGLGASAISRVPQGYAQNAVPVHEYAGRLAEGRLPVFRGMMLASGDSARGYAIERLMCDFRLNQTELLDRFGMEARSVIADAERIAAGDKDGMLVRDGHMFRVTERGRPFVRAICARLDPYLAAGAGRHSVAV